MNKQLFSLDGMTALVTGASGHLGRQICFGLAEHGAHVLVNSRSSGKALLIVEELQEKGLSAESAVFDVINSAEVDEFMASHSGDICIIVNNAYAGIGGTIETATDSHYRDSYAIVVEAAHNLVQKALPKLRDSVSQFGYASVINIGSMYGVVSPDLRIYPSAASSNPPFYGAAKAALVQWSKYGACEFGKEGIRFNTISPGPFPNPTTNDPEFMELLSNKVPMGRIGDSSEIQGPVIFLASKASSFVNGTNLRVDGGWTAW